MKKATKLIALILISALFVTLFTSCSELSSITDNISGAKLDGCIWEPETDDFSYKMPMKIELFSDGTGSVMYDNYEWDTTWIAESGRLKLASMYATYTYDYSVSDGKLSLTYDGENGTETVVYSAN